MSRFLLRIIFTTLWMEKLGTFQLRTKVLNLKLGLIMGMSDLLACQKVALKYSKMENGVHFVVITGGTIIKGLKTSVDSLVTRLVPSTLPLVVLVRLWLVTDSARVVRLQSMIVNATEENWMIVHMPLTKVSIVEMKVKSWR